jgi:hypothetical protein
MVMAAKDRDDTMITKIPDRVVRMELISLFTQYPGLVGTPGELSLRIRRDPEQVRRQVEGLVALRILDRIGEDEPVRYRYLAPISLNPTRNRRKTHYQAHRASGLSEEQDAKYGGGGKAKAALEEERETELRLKLMITTLKKESWKDCLELLMDTIHYIEGVPCAAYLLGERCSELLWDHQSGANGVKAGMTKIAGVQNMVVEGELIKDKGLLDTPLYIKYLYPLNEHEDVLICVCRKGSYHIDIAFLRSLFVDILPVVAEKRHLDMVAEKTAEKLLQENIYWNTVHNPDIRKGLTGALASVAKSVEAGRVSLLMKDDNGCLRTFSTYGTLKHLDAPGRVFRSGQGVAGWCVENGDTANLANPRVDPRFIGNDYNDIDSLLCCPLIPCEGESLGAICAVNKSGFSSNGKAHFDERDTYLFESIARTLAHALTARDNRTKRLPRKVIRAMMTA